MKRNSFYSLILGAVLICSCTEDSSVVYPSGNEDVSMFSKVTSVFTNGTNMSVGARSGTSRGGGTLTVGENEAVCAKYDVASGFQSNGTVPYIKVSIHVYEDCVGECEKLRLTFKGVEDFVCKADDFAIRATDGTYLEGCYGMDEKGNKINEYKYGNLSISGDMDIIVGGLDNLYGGNKQGGEEEPVINTFEVWIWPQNTEGHTWTDVELKAFADSHDPLMCVKSEPSEDPHPGVDMGDLIWAEENIEGYYAWGEIFTGKTIDHPGDDETASFTYDGVTYTNDASYYPYAKTPGKTHYNYNHYHYFDGTLKLTKYQWTADKQSQDGHTRLEPFEDVAVMRWGNGWRMPTSAEMDDLFNGPNTVAVEGTTQIRLYNHETGESYYEEVEAWMITSNETNNTVVLPKTGYYGSSEKTDSEASAHPKIKEFDKAWWPYTGLYYWTSDLSTQIHQSSSNKENRYGGFLFGAGMKGWCDESIATMAFDYGSLNGYDRCFGMKVRAVKDKQ